MPTLPNRVAYRREHTGDVSRDRAQVQAQKVSAAHEQTKAVVSGHTDLLALGMAPLGGLFLTNKTISNVGTTLAHKLGRTPVGYVVTRIRSTSAVGAFTVLDFLVPDASNLYLAVQTNVAGVQSIVCDLFIF